jgi:hypothetical protein
MTTKVQAITTILGALSLGLLLPGWNAPAAAPDPATVVGPDQCVDCHEDSYNIWQESTHYKTYDELSSNFDGLGIADKMGVDNIEDPAGECVSCHYTVTGAHPGKYEVIAGVSCESCHGGARDWLDTHGEYPNDDPANETAEQKQQRIAHAEAAGLLYPQRIERIAANCLSCHTVPDEKLVNVGEHPAASDFELVAWSQGEVRHNVFWNKGEKNAEDPPERKRIMYVVGRATDLQYSLLALAKATGPGKYLDAMQQRVENALAELQKIQQAQALPEIGAMLEAAQQAPLQPGSAAALEQAAAQVKSQIEAFVGAHDGKQLAALDGLLPTDYHYSKKYR